MSAPRSIPWTSGTTDERERDLCARAGRLLGRSGIRTGTSGTGTTDRPESAAQARSALEVRLAEDAGGWGRHDLLAACELLGDLESHDEEREERELRLRVAELGRLHSALDRLDGRPSAEVIDRAPEALNRSCDFGRTMISSISGSLWLPRRLAIADHSADHADEFHAFVASVRIPLAPQLLETDLIRRRMPALVADPAENGRTFKAIIRVARTASYVTAPIVSGGRTMGLLHADRLRRDGLVTTVDRDRLAGFATGFAVVHERALLRERLARQSGRAGTAFATVDAELEQLDRAELHLEDALRAAVDDVTGARVTGDRLEDGASRSRIDDALSSRERQVVRLMTTGATNAEIAARLLVAEGTVKSHVKSVFRKLRASSRAEAVARYTRLSQRPTGRS